MPLTEDRLVVYGSLMRNLPSASGAHEPDLLDRLGVGPGLRRVGPCRVGGVLFDLGAYPALRRSPQDSGSVCGELYSILDPAVLTVLDDFEGYDPRDAAGSDYLRERAELLEPPGGHAWVYVYNRAPAANLRVASGDWRAHLAERRRSAHDPVPSQVEPGQRKSVSRDTSLEQRLEKASRRPRERPE